MTGQNYLGGRDIDGRIMPRLNEPERFHQRIQEVPDMQWSSTASPAYSRLVVAIMGTFVLVFLCTSEAQGTLQETPVAPGDGQTINPGQASAISSDASQTQPRPSASFWDIVRASGVIGLTIFLLSVAGLALVIEHAVTIRRGNLLPPEFIAEVEGAIRSGQLARVAEITRSQNNSLAKVLAAGLAELDLGWNSVEKAMEEALAEESARFYRKVEYLSVIGNVAPMLGLLGTVVGMVMAFRRVAETQGAARAADLAEGIYLALVTTVEGLLVAIPALAAFAVFRNRVDGLMAEVGLCADRLLGPLKRQMLSPGGVPPRVSTPTPRGSRTS
jgi:biopolymer transport protein ExbB